jgi:ribosomal protein L37AE/L43A
MTTPIEVGTLWSIWNKAKQCLGFLRRRFEKYAALEARVTALEAALARCPGEACPFCGARTFRLKEVIKRESIVMRAALEIWKCAECQNQYEYRYDEPGRIPPGAKR